MSRWPGGWLLLLACSCNEVYGLSPTQLVDGRSIDAPARCTGETLVFSPYVRESVFRECTDYTFVRDTAVAACGAYHLRTIAEGPVDGPLADVAIEPSIPNALFSEPRLTPDDDLLVTQRSTNQPTKTVSVYRRANGWVWDRDLPFMLSTFEFAGVPSRGPQRHLMITRNTVVEEFVDDGNGGWTLFVTQPASMFGVVAFDSPMHLSADGLRAVFSSGSSVHYTVRERVSEPFSGAFPLDVPVTHDMFLSEDCGRLYFSGLERIYHVQR